MDILPAEVVTTQDDPERWDEASLASPARFARRESREQMAKSLRGLVAPVERANGWQVAEAVGDATPDRMPQRLSRVDGEVDATRDHLQAFRCETLGEPEGIGSLDEIDLLGEPIGTRSDEVPASPSLPQRPRRPRLLPGSTEGLR
jgi:hypothetical protein